MECRRLGNTDLIASELGFGCARLGGLLGGETRRDLIDMLHAAFDKGITFYDTADMYCQGESERLLGIAFRRRRDRVIIASKAGYRLPAQRVIAAKLKPVLRPVFRRLGIKRPAQVGYVRGSLDQDFSPLHLRRAVEGSLRRLNTDYLDLFQLHSPPQAVLLDPLVIEELQLLQREGKVRHCGVSCEVAADAELALRDSRWATLQLRINLVDPGATDTVAHSAQKQDVGLIARECFAGGTLAGMDAESHVLGSHETQGGEQPIGALRQVARAWGRPLDDLAVQYVRGSAGVTVVLLGMRTRLQLERNLQLFHSPRLSGADWQRLQAECLAALQR